MEGVKSAGSQITNSIAENGLSDWLAAVRRHHGGTYQHCMLMTGITVDFGLSLGVGSADLERLYMARCFTISARRRSGLESWTSPDGCSRTNARWPTPPPATKRSRTSRACRRKSRRRRRSHCPAS
jgi:hypothetical protein